MTAGLRTITSIQGERGRAILDFEYIAMTNRIPRQKDTASPRSLGDFGRGLLSRLKTIESSGAASRAAGPGLNHPPQVRERWLLPQVGAITPQYIEMTLRGALAGAHIPQWELFNLMEDTWPRLRKNVLELKMAVRNRRAVFEAYRDEDEQNRPPPPSG